MPKFSILKGAVVVLATVGVAFPQLPILASEQKVPSKPIVKVLAANSILDVSLSKDSALTGRTIDHNGNPVVGATVVVKRGKSEVARSVTGQHGNFAVQNLKPGVYEISSGATAGTYRVWSEKTSPPSAKPHSLLVLGKDGARGQYGLTETIAGENLGLILLAATTGLGLAALILALNAQSKADDANDAAAQANAREAALRQQLINNGIPVSP